MTKHSTADRVDSPRSVCWLGLPSTLRHPQFKLSARRKYTQTHKHFVYYGQCACETRNESSPHARHTSYSCSRTLCAQYFPLTCCKYRGLPFLYIYASALSQSRTNNYTTFGLEATPTEQIVFYRSLYEYIYTCMRCTYM